MAPILVGGLKAGMERGRCFGGRKKGRDALFFLYPSPFCAYHAGHWYIIGGS